MSFIKRHRNSLLIIGCFLFFLFCMFLTECDWAQFWKRREYLTDIVKKMFPPQTGYLPQIIKPLLATVQMSVVGTALGAFLALFTAPFCAGNMRNSFWFQKLLRMLIQILRSFPALILALFFTFLFGLGVFSGTMALTVYTFAIMTRLTYEDIEHSSLRPFEALRCMGCGFLPAYRGAVIPVIASSYFSNVLYLLETNVRHSAILGYIGAGGIGILLNETVSWRDYDKTGMILILLFITVAVIELLSFYLTSIATGRRTISMKQRRILISGFVLLFLVSVLSLQGPDLKHTNPTIIRNMLYGFSHPDLSFFFDLSKGGLVYLLLETVCISFAGTMIGVILSVPMAFFGSGRLMPKAVSIFCRTLILIIRSVPFMIYGLIFIRNTGPGSFAGVLTLSVCSIGLLSKRFTEAIDMLDFRAYQALAQMGVPWILRIRHAILPQLGNAFLQAGLYRFDVNIREASVLGMVGAGGIGATLVFSMNHYHWNQTGAIAIGLIVLAWIVDSLSMNLSRVLNGTNN